MFDLVPVRFYFGDNPTFDGLSDGSTWNGFDNIYVTAEVHKQISDHFRSEYTSTEYDAAGVGYLMQSFDEIRTDADGLYSYANGFATSIA